MAGIGALLLYERCMKKYDLEKIKELASTSSSIEEVIKKYGRGTKRFMRDFLRKNQISTSHMDLKFHHSEETKKRMSIKRKEYIANNAGKHNWKLFKRMETKPEKVFREILEKISGLTFFQEYIPKNSKRGFMIDFACTNLNIGFEINGNQHYKSDGTLKQYYIDRENYFNTLGWRLVQIHYSNVFKPEIQNLILESLDNPVIGTEKIQSITKFARPKKVKVKQTQPTAQQMAARIARRKVIRPTKDELSKLVWEIPTMHISKKYGVSDKAIDKWCKGYGIKKPCRGYWNKVKCGKYPTELRSQL